MGLGMLDVSPTWALFSGPRCTPRFMGPCEARGTQATVSLMPLSCQICDQLTPSGQGGSCMSSWMVASLFTGALASVWRQHSLFRGLRANRGKVQIQSRGCCSAPYTRTRCSTQEFPTGWEEFEYVAGDAAYQHTLAPKLVYVIRPAESESTAAGAVFPRGDPRRKAIYEDAQYFDAPLSGAGLQSCKEARLEGRVPEVQIVVCSPLTRALQTSTELFAPDGAVSGESLDVSSSASSFMTPSIRKPTQRVPPPVLALEAAREFNSSVFHPCDSRQRPDVLKDRYPWVDFRGVPEGIDTLLGPGLVETSEICDQRIHWLLAWIRMRRELKIAVVSHNAFIRRLLREHLRPAGWMGGERLGNLDVLTVPLAFLS